MSIIRTGSTKKFSDGWETAFGRKKSKKKKAPAKASGKPKKKK